MLLDKASSPPVERMLWPLPSVVSVLPSMPTFSWVTPRAILGVTSKDQGPWCMAIDRPISPPLN